MFRVGFLWLLAAISTDAYCVPQRRRHTLSSLSAKSISDWEGRQWSLGNLETVDGREAWIIDVSRYMDPTLRPAHNLTSPFPLPWLPLTPTHSFQTRTSATLRKSSGPMIGPLML